VQTAVHRPDLAADCEGELLQLAADLLQAAHRVMPATAATARGLAASLAAAAAAGAYTAHIRNQDSASAGDHGDNPSCNSPSSSTSAVSTSGAATAGATSNSAAAGTAGARACPEGCSVCTSATQLYLQLRCLEGGVLVATPPASAAHAAVAAAAGQHKTTLQQYLLQQLLALAWRHPVPGVCGNVLCGRLEGSSAVDVVLNRLGTLCGCCRAARYCCEECQQAAWTAHRKVCKHGR
jgi:hypothetical protein